MNIEDIEQLEQLYIEEAKDKFRIWKKYEDTMSGPNARLMQGKITTLWKVINDLRTLQDKEPLEDNWSGGFGYINPE